MESSSPNSKPSHLALWTTALLPVFFFLQIWWLDSSRFTVLAGDDVRCVHTALKGYRAYNNLAIEYARFRPITSAVISTSVALSGGEFPKLLSLSVAVISLNAILLFGILRSVARAPILVSLGLTVLAFFNRFSSYALTAELGLMEGAGLAVLIAFVWVSLLFLEKPGPLPAAGMALCFAVILHIHERYMVLLPVCLLVAALGYRRHARASLAVAAASLITFGLNVVAKKVFLNAPVLMGTTMQPIEFKPAVILQFVFDGAANLFGLNCGPSYLSTLAYSESPPSVKALSWTVAAATGLLIAGVIAVPKRLLIRLDWSGLTLSGQRLLTLAVTIAGLLASASITFRQEYRWLHPAYVVFVIFLGLIARELESTSHRRWVYLVLAGLIACGGLNEWLIRKHRDNFYARNGYAIATAFYEGVQRSPELLNKKALVIGGDFISAHAWVFMGNMFAELYQLPPMQFAYDARGEPASTNAPINMKFDSRTGTFQAVPEDAGSTEALSHATIVAPVNTALSTPNGRPLFQFSIWNRSGYAVTSPSVLDVPAVGPRREINLKLSHVYAQGDGLNVRIFGVLSDGRSTLLADQFVAPLNRADQPKWLNIQCRLPDGCQQVRLSLSSDSGDQSADWIIVTDFSYN